MSLKLYGIFGNPVLHSKSPVIQEAAFSYFGLPARYLRIAADSATDALEIGTGLGLSGCNVTAPFKEEMLALVSKPDPTAIVIGAVNTIAFEGIETRGFNSDVAGGLGSLQESGLDLSKQNILLIGAGGAAKALLYSLKNFQSSVVITSADGAKGEALAACYQVKHLALDSPEIFSEVKRATIIVNVSSSSDQLIPHQALQSTQLIMDAIYGTETALLTAARAVGAKTIDGQRWLLHQGLATFKFLCGKTVPLSVMEQALEKAHGNTPQSLTILAKDTSLAEAVSKSVAEKLGIPLAQPLKIYNSSISAGLSFMAYYADHSDTNYLNTMKDPARSGILTNLVSDQELKTQTAKFLESSDLVLRSGVKSPLRIADRIIGELSKIGI